MTMTDPIADLLTRIRNGGMAKQTIVNIPCSNIKRSISQILKEEGFIDGVEEIKQPVQNELRLTLRYDEDNRSVITMLQRVSKPGRRVYSRADEVPKVLGGLGIAILSTSQGVMTSREARKRGIGGEVLCYIA
ncbi:30S ribosomal protein S8 [bacterium]|nr:30S ribosomal protein S8 [candidate division CSSED10-310 bacterium]